MRKGDTNIFIIMCLYMCIFFFLFGRHPFALKYGRIASVSFLKINSLINSYIEYIYIYILNGYT